jgi:Protein of unknown function (DUF2950)
MTGEAVRKHRVSATNNGTFAISEDAMIITRSLFHPRGTPRPRLAALAAGALILLSTAPAALAQQTYKMPDEAAAALVDAARADDQKAELVVLGPDGEDIISSGDQVSDNAIRERFLKSYDAKHQIAMKGDNKAVLVIGDNDYPFPIPFVRKAGKWSFDTEEGRREILYRRIGHNELNAIQVCLAYVDAQDEYADKDRTGAGAGVYAERFISNPGKKDGLYWPTSAGEEESPLGELFAKASKQGYKAGEGRSPEGRSPYHGYYYKILTKQGAHAPGGAANYVVNGKMIGGFGLVAYPAEYRNSGVMTFIVNHSGTVFQKDLGPDTDDLAEKVTSFDPDSAWKKVEVTEPAK